MRSLLRAVRTAKVSAPVIPGGFPSLSAKGAHIRRGEVSMIAGPPGAGKSTLALAMAARAKVPTLYFSADTHDHTMSLRLVSMLSGASQTDVEPMLASDPGWAAGWLKQAENIRWCFEPAPTLRDLELNVEAHRTLMGTDPELIVFDNLIDASFESGDEYSSMRALMREFKWWARDTGAAFLVLHHTSEGVAGNPCPPRSSLHGKVAQTPAFILTVTSETNGFLGVCPVKNRYGPAAPGGTEPVWLSYSPANMKISDLTERDYA